MRKLALCIGNDDYEILPKLNCCIADSIEFELTDIENTEQYINKFEYDINISIDTEKHLHIYLDNIANYSGQAKVARKGRGRKSHV